MNVRQLEAFDAFMTTGSTTRASAELKISQPMVSRLLGQLEENVGFPLFLRKRNQLAPTPEAVLFHAKVSRSLAAFQDLEQEARSISNRQVGRIIVAAQPVYLDTFLLDVVARYKQQHPDVAVKVIDAGLEDLLRMFHDGSCDLGVGITLDASPYGASLLPLGKCAAVCLVPKTHRLAEAKRVKLDDISKEVFVELAIGSPLRTRVDYMMQSAGGQRKIAAEARTNRAVHGLVRRGVGIAIVDPLTSLLSINDDVVALPIEPRIEWEMAVFQHDDRPLSRIESAFVDTIRTEAEQLQEKGVLS
ncbi:MAG: LysR family transcriptional regulator [Roseibium sp.]|uniref:LysR substrate-binding domain-containing protein n=1 Tax=Roseibium sp. TaxID=1936156 RepID=UPI001B1B7B93|nr:LysR substrate-binding domain-containing protein [Roseibium sp.]MBO6511378.1 LysR family transcriptional regulator [Roseibium sp.]MBO6893257.1 LysR family transcriptional regulator [Roseibium sp.]MBO6930633.1 LysR family transcriptional regulator [Roseibium sp.]